MSIVSQVSPAVRNAYQKAAAQAVSGATPERVKVAGSSRDSAEFYWPRMIAVDIDDAEREYGKGIWVSKYTVYHFSDDMRIGEGCAQCLYAGRIGVFVPDELEPYLCERCCPNCDSDSK